MDEIIAVKKLVLQKLTRANIWGGKHTPFDFIAKGLPEKYRMTHQGQRIIKRALKELQNDQWINLEKKRTDKGSDVHISLNPKMADEILQFLENNQ